MDPNDLSGHEVIGYDPSLANLPAAQWLEANVDQFIRARVECPIPGAQVRERAGV